ncbi:fimbrial protein [Buttiauxella sp. S19-1]|uniref:fimbrial protein n=1 Tax=Buttiauxella sp. S19-1 TaxID=941430 RepID=UPI001EDA54A4|nr:fimbrial protein [Buttiauxella sp. S19-1]
MKRVFLGLIGLLMMTLAPHVWAAACQSIGATQEFNFNYVKNITDPDQNVISKTAYQQNWNSPNNLYYGRCACQDTRTVRKVHYRAVSSLSRPVPSTIATPDPNKHWYVIPNDKGDGYLGVATQVYIAGNRKQFYNVPFTMDNNYPQTTLCPTTQTNANRIQFGTGAQGKISLMFIRPFIGHVTIPKVKIIDLFAATDSSSFSGMPIASVYVSGDVTVPQSCRINDGKAIEVPFGQIAAKDILTKGQAPDGFTKRQIIVNYQCTNIADRVALELTMEAVPATSLPNAVATDNPDIGVMVGDQNLQPFISRVTKIPVTFSSQTQQGSTTLYAWPVNTTGKRPQRGPFSATASLNINLK